MDTPQKKEFDTSDVRDAPRSRSVSVYLLLTLLVFQGLSGIVGGIGLIADPTGASLGIPIEWLEGTLFSSYLIPGFVLMTLLGVVPLVVSTGLWLRTGWWLASALAVGLMLLIWLGVEIAIIGYQAEPPLQVIYGLVGLGIVSLALSHSVRSDPGGTRAQNKRRQYGPEDPRERLRVVRLLHTIVWAFFAGCIVILPFFAWQERFGVVLVLAGFVFIEVIILAMNSWSCPLTFIAERYTDDRRDNFDIYLPEWLARHNKLIFGTLYAGGLGIALYRFIF